jgi:hypothetical protein
MRERRVILRLFIAHYCLFKACNPFLDCFICCNLPESYARGGYLWVFEADELYRSTSSDDLLASTRYVFDAVEVAIVHERKQGRMIRPVATMALDSHR